MATATQQGMENVERRRLQLEENVAKLTIALEHWSTWEEEYEMLKEELQNAGSPSPSQMIEIGHNLGGTLVNAKEVEELLGKDLQTKRTANQVVEMISRRIDYVQQNRSTVEKQLETAEKQLAGVSILLDPGLENEEGLPMMDIEEELDEDENVISGSVSQPGKVAPELMEALRKAGLHKAEQKSESATASSVPSSNSIPASVPAPRRASAVRAAAALEAPSNVKSEAKQPSIAVEPIKPEVSQRSAPKKSVSFSEDTKPAPSTKKGPEPRDTGVKDDLKYMNFKPGSKVYELDDDENLVGTHIMPKDESQEDAELRREMLQYGLSEVGQVVAELDLEDPDAGYSDDMDDEEYGSEVSEEEDEHGRTTRSVLTEDYKRQMMDLEKKLNARMIENVGPRPDTHPLADHVDDVRTLRVKKNEEFGEPMDAADKAPAPSSPKKKGVRFADSLDVSDAPEPTRAPTGTVRPSSMSTPTMSDIIVERSALAPRTPASRSTPAKLSRFKSSRASASQIPDMLPNPSVPQPPPVPTGPAGRPLANAVVEHIPQSSEPQAPDEFDAVLVNREVQAEYHKMRNKMIQRQGGFVPTEEDMEDPLVEERDGKTKKVSRFKAARLKGEGL
ncbi:hypothetical protein BU26DRAFT_524395 [Trematosphaeria pertusa]|uniref:DUF3835 domain-containing protein n=1 Tax=Trematosphaeria pertusa TaxID=390896 RepID=A0A6A6HVH8_9PLEO|nr:uncharacterized protein BU26DRAFT_524395 [Trematosphaeria pertusa]KAF2242204.1 hypothetical protein BU26DRAFT_524395 [Trematosphaeria pertusa]